MHSTCSAEDECTHTHLCCGVGSEGAANVRIAAHQLTNVDGRALRVVEPHLVTLKHTIDMDRPFRVPCSAFWQWSRSGILIDACMRAVCGLVGTPKRQDST